MEHAVQSLSERYLEPIHTSKMQLLRKKLKSLSIFAKSFILNVRMGSKYASLLYPWKFAKMHLLSELSKFLHKFTSLLFFKLVVLNAALFTVKFFQQIFSNGFQGKLKIFNSENVISESLFRNLAVKIPESFLLKCVICAY